MRRMGSQTSMVCALVHGHATVTRTRSAINQPVSPPVFLLQNHPNHRRHLPRHCLLSQFIPHAVLQVPHRQRLHFLRCHRLWEIPNILPLNQHSRKLSPPFFHSYGHNELHQQAFSSSLLINYLLSFCALYYHNEHHQQADGCSYDFSNLSTVSQTHVRRSRISHLDIIFTHFHCPLSWYLPIPLSNLPFPFFPFSLNLLNAITDEHLRRLSPPRLLQARSPPVYPPLHPYPSPRQLPPPPRRCSCW